jgi:hypothetical protein
VERNESFHHPPVLYDETLNGHLFKYGYAHFPLLYPDEVDALRKLFFQYHQPDELSGLYITANRKDRLLIYEINEQMNRIFARAIEKHFQNVKKLGGTFIVKNPDPSNILHPHQDWNIVDETRYRSFTVWVPLQDISEQNGVMYVLPGSHNWIRGYRHITIDSVYGKIYDLAWQYSVPVYMKAGDALVFDHALAHASKPNYTREPRICASYGLISEGAEMRIYLNNNGNIEEYACTPDYYLEPLAQTGPHPFPLLKVVDFKPVQLDETGFFEISGIKKAADKVS